MAKRGPSNLITNEGIRLIVYQEWENRRPTEEMIRCDKESKTPHPMDDPRKKSGFVLEAMSQSGLAAFGQHVCSCHYCKSLLYPFIKPRPPLVPVNPPQPTE